MMSSSTRFIASSDATKPWVGYNSNRERYELIVNTFKEFRQLAKEGKVDNHCVSINRSIEDTVVKLLQYDGWNVSKRPSQSSKRPGAVDIKISSSDANYDLDIYRLLLLNRTFEILHKSLIQSHPYFDIQKNFYTTFPHSEPFQVETYEGVNGGFKPWPYTDDQLFIMGRRR